MTDPDPGPDPDPAAGPESGDDTGGDGDGNTGRDADIASEPDELTITYRVVGGERRRVRYLELERERECELESGDEHDHDHDHADEQAHEHASGADASGEDIATTATTTATTSVWSRIEERWTGCTWVPRGRERVTELVAEGAIGGGAVLERPDASPHVRPDGGRDEERAHHGASGDDADDANDADNDTERTTIVVAEDGTALQYGETAPDPPLAAPALLAQLADTLPVGAYPAGATVARMEGWQPHTVEIVPPEAAGQGDAP
jgi:hypothetical protein